jgi:hypothetical protein
MLPWKPSSNKISVRELRSRQRDFIDPYATRLSNSDLDGHCQMQMPHQSDTSVTRFTKEFSCAHQIQPTAIYWAETWGSTDLFSLSDFFAQMFGKMHKILAGDEDQRDPSCGLSLQRVASIASSYRAY